ncbi:hypothetical protein PM082_007827 [Marasmius tenuissimus]|nr:hypothetical protein PM082_007827 [Marasmius tenuissimus]
MANGTSRPFLGKSSAQSRPLLEPRDPRRWPDPSTAHPSRHPSNPLLTLVPFNPLVRALGAGPISVSTPDALNSVLVVYMRSIRSGEWECCRSP